ncbi:MAG: serine/threonine protein kinase [Fimbriiglobus sp.]|nr:serine/threonine protein kinase [Fimbriiglobus sp.]
MFDLPTGCTLGHFEVIGPLGAGGMATVFKAKDLTLGREVALKILPPPLASDPDAVSRFKFEARAAAKLNHDHVARVFFIGEDRGLHFIAFEFVDGRTLRDLIDFHGPLAPADAVRYLLDVAVGLQHAAERGVVHRDVKPSNIIITPSGRAKLIDMGLARSIDPQSVNGGVTQSGMTLGTFDYISPEQAIDPRRADVRSDIYSLGCTFYHALTGQTPVPDGNAARKLAAHQTEAPTDPRLINPNVPDELAAVMDRMMAKLPTHRQQSAEELITELNRVAVALGLTNRSAEPSVVHTVTPTPAGRNRTSILALAMAVAALSLAVMVLAVAGSRQTGGPPPVPWADTKSTTAAIEPLPVDPPPGPRVPTQVGVKDTAELVKVLKEGVPRVTLAAGTYDLTGEAGLVVSCRAVEWDAPDGPAVLRLTGSPRGDRPGDPRAGTLTFHKCESVKLRGLRVEVTPTVAAEVTRGIGLLFHDVGSLELAECRFSGPGTGAGDGAVLALTRVTSVVVKHGFFQAKNWAAVELSGGPKAEFTECGFITGRASVEVMAGDPAVIAMNHVTFLLQNTAAAVGVAKGGRCELTAGHCLFAAPATADTSRMMDRRAVMVRSADATEANTVIIPDGAPSAVFQVESPTDVSVVTLPASPWANPPRADADNPFAVLELNPKLPPVRVGKVDLLGVRQWSDRRWMYTPWPLTPLVRAGEAVWAPKMTDAELTVAPANVFTDLKAAVAYLKGRGTLLVRGRGPLSTPSVVIDGGNKSITVKPDEDSTPVLVPAAGNDRRETTLFRLEAGELHLEGLQFELKPARAAEAAALVAMTGGKKCELKRCVVTLDEEGGQRAAVASFTDVGKLMVMKEFTDQPVLSFEHCLIRGRGSVVRAEATVNASITLAHVGIVTGSAPAFDLGPPARAAAVSLTLSHVSAALSGAFLDFRGARRPDDRPATKIEIHPENCLFFRLDETTDPLLRITALDPNTADRSLAWFAGAGNAFGGWVTFAEVLADETADPKKWDASEWRKWSGEPESATVQLKRPPAMKATARPTDLEPTEPTSAGANLKLLAPFFPE